MLFYTMDWCECSLAQRKVTPEELLQLAKKLTSALAALHEQGLIHRDIKPDNIFFRDGEIVLGDIGLVTQEENASFAGSPGFLTPALLAGHAPNIYSDCYALAKSFYCILSGQRPGKFPYYSGSLSPATSILMRAAMAICADEPRIHNTTELLDFLKSEEQRKPTLWEKLFRNPLLPGLFAALLLILTVFAAVWFLRGKFF